MVDYGLAFLIVRKGLVKSGKFYNLVLDFKFEYDSKRMNVI